MVKPGSASNCSAKRVNCSSSPQQEGRATAKSIPPQPQNSGRQGTPLASPLDKLLRIRAGPAARPVAEPVCCWPPSLPPVATQRPITADISPRGQREVAVRDAEGLLAVAPRLRPSSPSFLLLADRLGLAVQFWEAS